MTLEDEAYNLLIGDQAEGWKSLVPDFEERLRKMIRLELSHQGTKATALSAAEALASDMNRVLGDLNKVLYQVTT